MARAKKTEEVASEKKEVKKRVVKKKPETKVKKEIDIVDEIKDDEVDAVEELEFKEEVTPKKTLRELRAEFKKKKHDIEIEIINLTSGRVECRDRSGREIFSLDTTGDRDFITLAEMSEVASRYKGMFRKHWIAIIDIDSEEYEIEDVLTYLNIDEVYEDNGIENYDTDYVGQILRMDVNKFERFVENADLNLVKAIAGRAVDMYKNKKFDSRIKEQALTKRLGKEDLFDI